MTEPWSKFDKRREQSRSASEDEKPVLSDQTAEEFYMLFSGQPGRKCLAWLRQHTKERVLGPNATDSALRDLEGQRRLVSTIESLIEAGRQKLQSKS